VSQRITSLAPRRSVALPYTIRRRTSASWRVVSDIPVHVFLLGDEGLAQFNRGDPTIETVGGGGPKRRVHEEESELPSGGVWYLLVFNPSDTDAAHIFHELSA